MRYRKRMNKRINPNYCMYMMVGLPGSGKDTFISTYLKDCTVICRDDIREEVTDGNVLGRKLYLDREGEDKVTQLVNDRIKECCKGKKSFVINQTNIKRIKRLELRDYAIRCGGKTRPKIVYVRIIPPSIEECIKRRDYGIWTDIINNMNDGFEEITGDEYDELITVTQKEYVDRH